MKELPSIFNVLFIVLWRGWPAFDLMTYLDIFSKGFDDLVWYWLLDVERQTIPSKKYRVIRNLLASSVVTIIIKRNFTNIFKISG